MLNEGISTQYIVAYYKMLFLHFDEFLGSDHSETNSQNAPKLVE